MTSNQPTHRPRPTSRFVGVAVVALVAAAGVGATALRGNAADDGPPTIATTPAATATVPAAPAPARTASVIIQDEIDGALARRHATTTTAAGVERQQGSARATAPATSTPRPAYLVIQDEIDRALEERGG